MDAYWMDIHPLGTLDPSMLEQLYVTWLTRCGISFRMVQSDEFRAYVISNLLLKSKANNRIIVSFITLI